ncbi:2-amino-4-hydroxy-6-hydroxymethyldihydropteridine diphosphokinase [Cohaesibacter marisflavi]|uniref:2-amino-4-hydroxy-6- hydroxymethyldihydropteridine diphosphokinase n=1 Tax=Cohaesibacter marisflavi TaxID=655353 RepID=UPI0029C66B0E|nr:2-amino-4-hydroxy-6-hydroxymethyldihydropteridine diphosphokinase [Cohaesibacter marisflavi]
MMNGTSPETEVYISLGGNIGDPAITIEDALSTLSSQKGVRVMSRSPYYITPPWGKTDQAEFINACALIKTTLPASELLAVCLAVEKSMGRIRGEHWGPRIIDIDLLTYGDQVIDEDNLKIPHPFINERAFVLVPLRDLAPDFSLNGQSIDSMLENLDVTGISLLDKHK